MKKLVFASLALGVCMTLVMSSCKKNNYAVDKDIVPPSEAKFNVLRLQDTSGTYYVKSTGDQFKIPIGVTTVSSSDRTLNLCYSSTSAVAGQQYNAPATIKIPAGKTVDTLSISGLFAGYPTSTKIDTVYITICGGDVASAKYQNQYRLIMRKYCDVVPADMVGAFTRSTDTYNGSASTKPNYTATVTDWTPVAGSSTKATVVFHNVGATSDNGWGPFGPTDPAITPGLTATLDWTSAANFSVTIPKQDYFDDGSGMSTITATGTFSSCDQTYTITCDVTYAGNGRTYRHVSYLRR